MVSVMVSVRGLRRLRVRSAQWMQSTRRLNGTLSASRHRN